MSKPGEQMTGETRELRPQLRGREPGAAGDDQRAAGERAPAIGRAIGVAVHDADTRRLQAELVGDQLRERRGEALAVGEAPIRASTKPDGSIAISTRS